MDIWTYGYIDIWTYGYMDIWTYGHMDIWTYGHTDIQTHRHTDIQTYRHTDIQTYRHTDIQTYGHTDTRTHKHTNIQTYKHTDIWTLLPQTMMLSGNGRQYCTYIGDWHLAGNSFRYIREVYISARTIPTHVECVGQTQKGINLQLKVELSTLNIVSLHADCVDIGPRNYSVLLLVTS